MTRSGPTYNRRLADGSHLIVHPRHRILAYGLHMGLMLTTIAALLALLTYPLTRGITARLARLQTGVLQFGAGNLAARVKVEGRDEVAALAKSFNESAEHIEKLVRAHQMLLANCSHELRTPLARIRLGVERVPGTDPEAERRAGAQHRRARCAHRRDAAFQPARCVERHRTRGAGGSARARGRRSRALRSAGERRGADRQRRCHAAAPAGAQPARECARACGRRHRRFASRAMRSVRASSIEDAGQGVALHRSRQDLRAVLSRQHGHAFERRGPRAGHRQADRTCAWRHGGVRAARRRRQPLHGDAAAQ